MALLAGSANSAAADNPLKEQAFLLAIKQLVTNGVFLQWLQEGLQLSQEQLERCRGLRARIRQDLLDAEIAKNCTYDIVDDMVSRTAATAHLSLQDNLNVFDTGPHPQLRWRGHSCGIAATALAMRMLLRLKSITSTMVG